MNLTRTAPAFEDLDALAEGLVRDRIAPNVAVGAASRRAGRWEMAFGGSTHAIFDLASLTKPMTAFSVARFGLDRSLPLGAVLSEALQTPSHDVPLELLLAHRGGLEANYPLFRALMSGGAIDRAAAFTEAASARRADALDPRPAAGFVPVYSDLGYILAGEVLARQAGGRDAGEVIEKFVAEAMGMRDELGTARALEARKVEFMARVVPTEIVAWRGGEVRGRVHDENAWALAGDGGLGHAGMFGTVRGVVAFGCAALDAIARGEGPLATPGDPGWLVRERDGGSLRAGFDGKSVVASSAGERAGPRTFGHLGFTGTSLWIDPDAEAVVVLLTNRVHPTRENVAIRAARPWVHDALFAHAARSPNARS